MPRMCLTCFGLTMHVKDEKPNEVHLDVTRRRCNSWCEDRARVVRVVLSVLEGLGPRPVLERLIHPLEIREGEFAIVLRAGTAGSVMLVHERQVQHEVGLEWLCIRQNRSYTPLSSRGHRTRSMSLCNDAMKERQSSMQVLCKSPEGFWRAKDGKRKEYREM